MAITGEQYKNALTIIANSLQDRLELANDILAYVQNNHLTHGEKNGLIKYAKLQISLCTGSVSDIRNNARSIAKNEPAYEPDDLPF